MNAKTPPETESFDAAELGAMMREMRENLGHDLDAVARDLRIRLVYLEAIESGRLTDLPGNAYVSGFLRSYSGRGRPSSDSVDPSCCCGYRRGCLWRLVLYVRLRQGSDGDGCEPAERVFKSGG
jgi:hypothetical protein